MGLSPWFLERRENQEIYQLEFGETLVGRMETTQIVITSVFASRKHCIITVFQDAPNDVYLEDLGTCNGTYINSIVRKREKVQLREGDNIGIGCTIADHDDDKYFTFSLKRDNVPIENIIINIDDDEEEEEEEEEEGQDVMVEEDASIEVIEDDPEEEEVVFEDEQEIDKELSFSLKQEMVDEIIEIEDIFSECDNNNIDDNEDLFHQYKLKQELSMREQNSDIVLISDSEDEDIEEMNNWVLKLSQNFDCKKFGGDVKQESDEENNDADILYQLRSELYSLPGDDNIIKGEPIETSTAYESVEKGMEIPSVKTEVDDFIQVEDPPLTKSDNITESRPPSPEKLQIPLRRCSVLLDSVPAAETKLVSDRKEESESEDEVKPPRKKFKRLLSISNKALFGLDEDEEENEGKSHKKKEIKRDRSDASSSGGTKRSKSSADINKRKSSRDSDERPKPRSSSREKSKRSSSREKSDLSEPGSSKVRRTGEERHEHKRCHSSSKQSFKSKHGSKSKEVRPKNDDHRDKSNKKAPPEPEIDPDFIEKPVPKATGSTTTKADNKKPRQLEVIEPLNMPNRKRDKLRPFNELRRIQNRAIVNEKNENNVQNLKNKFKEGYSSKKPKPSRTEMENFKEKRKNRLQLLTLPGKNEKNDDEIPKVVNIPKVKVTEQNRGSFLMEALPCKIPGRRKSVSAAEMRNQEKLAEEPTKTKVKMTEQNRGSFLTEALPCTISGRRKSISATEIQKQAKPVEEPKISKPSSLNDFGTVGKSISSLPKIPKVAKAALQTSNPEPIIPLETSLTKTALKPRIARNVSQETLKSPISSGQSKQSLPDSDVIPKKSILTKEASLQTNSKKLKSKSVRFSDVVDIREYEVAYDRILLNVSEAMLKENGIAKLKKNNRPPSLHFHPAENVVNDITRWNPDWLKTSQSSLPPINGSNILLPNMHTYRNCKEYENVMIPLLKVELWQQIYNCYDMRKNCRCRATVMNSKLLPKGNDMRYEYVCELNSGMNPSLRDQIKEGMFLLVQAGDRQFFSYMVFKDFMRTRDRQVTYVTIQSAKTDTTDAIQSEMVVDITFLVNIRIEVISMGFIYDLKESPLCDMILNPPIHIEVPSITGEYNPLLDVTLNENQYNIVDYTTKQCTDSSKPSIIMIDGPPGTGKSYLISNLVATLLSLPESTKLKILICSASNTAIDIIMEKMIHIRQESKKINRREIRLIRHGVEEKMSPAVRPFSVQNLCKKNVDSWRREIESSSVVSGASVKSLINEQQVLEQRINFLNQNSCSNNFNEMPKLVKDLNRIKSIINGNHMGNNDIKNKEKQLMLDLIHKADVICTTLTSCVQLMRHLRSVDVCIIDEATQCTEPCTIIPLKFKIKKLILVGDTKQLPAVVLATNAKDNGLGNSLFTRIQHSFEVIADTPVLPMTTQYRMHPEICEFPNKYFYGDQLRSSYKINADVPLRPYSVISLDFMQNATCSNSSIYNKDEAKFISHLAYEISKLVDTKKVQIGIITPYQQQKTEISQGLSCYNLKGINVNTIDSFQGKEADIILFATTRTSGTGFLSHPQRLNVALTRARHSLIICGNFIHLKHAPFWSSLVQDAIVRQVFYKFDNFKTLIPKLI